MSWVDTYPPERFPLPFVHTEVCTVDAGVSVVAERFTPLCVALVIVDGDDGASLAIGTLYFALNSAVGTERDDHVEGLTEIQLRPLRRNGPDGLLAGGRAVN